MTTSSSHVSLGGNVDGWDILAPAPEIRWENLATGESGVTGQTSGTWVVNGGVDLQPGANRLVVRASNDIQDDGWDEITVQYRP